MKKHCAAEMKLYFGEHEMRKNECFAKLERTGFTIESELESVIVDPIDVVVECENNEIIPICVSPSTLIIEIANETCKTLKLPIGSVDMMIGDSEVNRWRMMSEMEIESGIWLKCRMKEIWNIFDSKEKITVEKIKEGIENSKKWIGWGD
jgi:hypothetical protein